MVVGLGMRIRMRMRTKLENGCLRDTVVVCMLVEHSGLNKKKNGTFATAHICVSLSSTWHLAIYMSLADHKGTRERGRLGA